MNKPIIYLPICILVVASIVHLSLSVPSFSLIIHFPRFLYVSAFLAILSGFGIYKVYKQKFDFDNIYKLTASTVLFSFVVFLAGLTLINEWYTTKNCFTASYKIVGYKGRYTSGLGNIKKEELEANQWILSIVKNDKVERFVLNTDISTDNRVTKTMDLQFCKGLLGTEFFNIEQITY